MHPIFARQGRRISMCLLVRVLFDFMLRNQSLQQISDSTLGTVAISTLAEWMHGLRAMVFRMRMREWQAKGKLRTRVLIGDEAHFSRMFVDVEGKKVKI